MLRVFGSRISYYTGKLESYLRFRSIPYERCVTIGREREIIAGAGAVQHPVARLEDGRWMSDTTPMLRWFEGGQSAPSIYPDDPGMRFAALLLEDYADEWLWRPAMHYRWSYLQDREYASGLLADEQLAHMRLPRWMKRRRVVTRQLGGFVHGDGVSEETRDHVEQGYLRALDLLEAIFSERPFILGDTPSIADFGFMGPMLRHFGQDPTPAEIMRSRAPGVYEWVARMWNAKPPVSAVAFLAEPDEKVAALLAEAAETHLVQLRENASAIARGDERYDQTIQGCRYSQVPSSRYRVWCLEQLRKEWKVLDSTTRDRVRALLPSPDSEILGAEAIPADSGYDPEDLAPFNRAINVFGTGVPR